MIKLSHSSSKNTDYIKRQGPTSNGKGNKGDYQSLQASQKQFGAFKSLKAEMMRPKTAVSMFENRFQKKSKSKDKKRYQKQDSDYAIKSAEKIKEVNFQTGDSNDSGLTDYEKRCNRFHH